MQSVNCSIIMTLHTLYMTAPVWAVCMYISDCYTHSTSPAVRGVVPLQMTHAQPSTGGVAQPSTGGVAQPSQNMSS